jgi:hypothetical protein
VLAGYESEANKAAPVAMASAKEVVQYTLFGRAFEDHDFFYCGYGGILATR